MERAMRFAPITFVLMLFSTLQWQNGHADKWTKRQETVALKLTCRISATFSQTHGLSVQARTPRPDESLSYSPNAQVFADRAKHHMSDTGSPDQMTTAAENARRALFHAPQNFGLYRNLAVALGKLAQYNMENKGNYRIARESMGEAAAAYRMAAAFGDGASQKAHDVLKDDVFFNYFGKNVCIDPLSHECDTLDAILDALEKIKDPETASEGVRWLCNGVSSITITISDDEKKAGRISVPKIERASAIMRVCGVVLIENAINEEDFGILEKIADEYRNRTRDEMQSLEDRVGVQGRGEGRWEVQMPPKEHFTDLRVIGNPFVLPIVKAILRTGNVEIDTFGNLLSFPQSGGQDWHRDVADIYSRPTDNSTTMNRLPPHGIVMTVPLKNLKLNHGPTEFALGSHMAADMFGMVGFQTHYKKLPRVKVTMPKGAVCLFDIRVQHQGTPNKGKKSIRQLLYISYVAQWFADRINDNHPYSREFDHLPTGIHQKLLGRLDTRQYVKVLEYQLASRGVSVANLRSKYIFDRSQMEV